MEIKRRLTKITKSLNPQVEAMNVAAEIMRHCSRIEELVTYAQTKINRAAERKVTIGKQVKLQKEAEQKAIDDAQSAEAAENLKDQQEAFDERNEVVTDAEEENTGEGEDPVEPDAG